jgi:vitamin-K-epoxide reductase (warfarin-sensitive)
MRVTRILIALLALAGAVVSVLALRIHMQDPNAAPPCAVTENWDCGAVNHSRFAVFPPRSFDENPQAKGHIPIAVFGIVGYLVIVVLALFGFDFWAFEAAQIGFFFALILTFLEKYVLEKWCIYCVWSQGLMTVILLSTLVAVFLRRRASRKSIFA